MVQNDERSEGNGEKRSRSRGEIKRNEKKKRLLALYFSTVRSTEQRQDGNSSI